MKHPYPFLLMITLCSLFLPVKAQKPKADQKLEHALQKIVKEFNGTIGVYVYNLKTHKEAAINADTIFPTASVVKVPILIGLFDKIENEELKYNQPLIYTRDLDYGGSGLMTNYRDSAKT